MTREDVYEYIIRVVLSLITYIYIGTVINKNKSVIELYHPEPSSDAVFFEKKSVNWFANTLYKLSSSQNEYFIYLYVSSLIEELKVSEKYESIKDFLLLVRGMYLASLICTVICFIGLFKLFFFYDGIWLLNFSLILIVMLIALAFLSYMGSRLYYPLILSALKEEPSKKKFENLSKFVFWLPFFNLLTVDIRILISIFRFLFGGYKK